MSGNGKGFRTAMEEASDINSIYGSENLEPRSADGSIFYEVYGMADSGLEQSVNEDNLYMDGIYMKSFQFSHYSKGIKTYGNNALFALCGPVPNTERNSENQDAKQAIDSLDSIRGRICDMPAENARAELESFFKYGIPNTVSSRLAFGAVYVSQKSIAVLSAGGAGIYRLVGKRLHPVGGSRENVFCYQKMELNKKPEVISRKKEETFVICSPIMDREFSLDSMAETVLERNPENAVRDIMDKGVTMCKGMNISMMVIRIVTAKEDEKPAKKLTFAKSKVPKIVAAVAAGALVIGGIAFGINAVMNSGPKIETTGETTLGDFNAEKESAKIDERLKQLKEDYSPLQEQMKTYSDDLQNEKYNEIHSGENWQKYSSAIETAKGQFDEFDRKMSEAEQSTDVKEKGAMETELQKMKDETLPGTLENLKTLKSNVDGELSSKNAPATQATTQSQGQSKTSNASSGTKSSGTKSSGYKSSGSKSSGTKSSGSKSSGGSAPAPKPAPAPKSGGGSVGLTD